MRIIRYIMFAPRTLAQRVSEHDGPAPRANTAREGIARWGHACASTVCAHSCHARLIQTAPEKERKGDGVGVCVCVCVCVCVRVRARY